MTGPMLALVTDAFGGRGGIAQYNRDFLSALSSQARIVVLPRHALDPVGALPNGIEQVAAQPGRIAYTFAALKLAAQEKPRIIFCGHLFMAPLAAVLARIERAQLIVQMHGIEAWQRPTPSQRRAVERADLVLAVSRDTRAKILNWAALAPERVAILPNTVGVQFTAGDRTAARGRFGLASETILLSVGRLAPTERYKGHDLVIAALPQLVAAGHQILYLIAGDGADRDRLQRLAQDLGVAARVRFLGQVAAAALPDLYRAADLFVLPSTGEGFGIVFLEAMACGTPALGLAVAGATDALADGRLGIAASPEDFAAALSRQLAAETSTARTLPQAVQARFGRDLFAARANALIERCAA